MSRLRGNRQFLGNSIPFLIGANPDRVAPVHVYNGFMTACFGGGPNSEKIALFMRNGGAPPEHLSESILNDEQKLRGFADSLFTILNPDRRVFPSGKGGSPFPLCCGVFSSSPSDDQIGKQMAALVQAIRPKTFDALDDIFSFGRHGDALTALGSVLNDGYQAKREDPVDDRIERLLKNSGSFAKAHLTCLAELVERAANRRYSTLSAQLVSLGRTIYLSSYLACLRTPVLATKKPRSWDDLEPCFVFGDKPPGNTHSPSVRLAVRSFSQVVDEIRNSLSTLIESAVEKEVKRIPRRLPKSSRTSVLIKNTFPHLSKRLREKDLSDLIKSAQEPTIITDRIVEAVYPIEFLNGSYRRLGRMLGLAGPDRGVGYPRFLLETPLLGALVEGTLDEEEALSFDEWIDRVYERFGLILGIGRHLNPNDLLEELDRPGPLDRAIRESHEALRVRLIVAGLAVEYSDGETELINRGHPS